MSRSPKSIPPQSPPDSVDGANRWTFLTNHAHVLIALSANPDLVLREVALRVGITERGVQRIVQDLEDGGFIRREKIGRKNHYQVLTDQPLRHPIEAHRTIGDLLKLINGLSAP
ncbi:MAG: helix-turn-helix domain-containing protein [Pirellulaceae bacterium]